MQSAHTQQSLFVVGSLVLNRWNPIHDHGTSHVSIVDKDRNAVSMTNTINGYFGAKFLSSSTGIVLNNEMDDFSMPENTSANEPPPAPANFVHPGKRPFSSMSPTIILQVINSRSLDQLEFSDFL